MADARQIERVIANLISNAVKATPEGGRITVSARKMQDHLQVSVADTGRGIPAEYLPRLFEEFVQVPDAETGSAGLGLSISKRIINAHGGSITAASARGGGATFYLYAARRGRPSASPISRGTHMSRRVLVIDDEPNIRRMIRITLEADGYEVEDAADGKTGLDTFGDGSRFDVVVLDQKMPGMDGLEILKHLRTRAAGMPVVMATAFGSIELAVDAMKAGATDFLRKPLTPDTLRGAVLAAAAKRPPRKPDSSARADVPALPMPTADLWTVNGFFIRAPSSLTTRVRRTSIDFSVRHAGKGPHGDVTVVLSDPDMSRIARLTGRQPPPSRAFWQRQAERALMNYMFLEAALPPGNRLAIDRLSDDTVLCRA